MITWSKGARRLLLAGVNGLLLAALTVSSSVTTLGPARAARAGLGPDTIALTARLEEFEYTLQGDRAALFTVRGSGRAYLAHTGTEVLSGATLRYEFPRLHLSGGFVEEAAGIYRAELTERIRIEASVPFRSTRDWKLEQVQVLLDGEDLQKRVTRSDRQYRAKNQFRRDVTGTAVRPYADPQRVEVSAHLQVRARLVQPGGAPAAGVSLTLSFPDRDNYSETFTTDADGWVQLERTETLYLYLAGGQLQTLAAPLSVPAEEDPVVLFWWEEPEERCAVDTTLSPTHGLAIPGSTAVYDFQIVNLGNRPKEFTIQTGGVPAAWVDKDAETVFLLPFFSATVRVGVTPAREPATVSAPHTLAVTAASDCASHTSSAGLKVGEYREPVLDVYGSRPAPTGRLAPGLMADDYRAERREQQQDLIVLARGPVDDAMRKDIRALGGTIRRSFDLVPGFAITIPGGKADDLSRLPWVEQVSPNRRVQALLNNSVPALGAPALWDLGLTGRGVTVAVVDTGVDFSHPFLQGALLEGKSFVDGAPTARDGHGHGTHVAGIIASRSGLFRGVAPEAMILPVKVLTDEGWGTYESVLAGMDYAVGAGADVINLSLGASGGDGTDPLARAVDAAMARGVVVAVAAGNGGPFLGSVSTPGDSRLGITVGATDVFRQLMDWSSRGPTADGRAKPDLVAPGQNITSSVPGGGWEAWSGTSMSAPHVAGLAALLLQGTGPVDPLLIKEALKKTARDLGHGPNAQGAGFPDPPAALAYARARSGVVQQVVYPGQVAVFTYRLTNNGNVADTFRITQTYYEFSQNKYAAYPARLGGSDPEAQFQVEVAAGATYQGRARVAVAADWALMEDTVYPLAVVARSAADRSAVSQEYATVKVKATKRSMIEYLKHEARWFREDLAQTPSSDAGWRPRALRRADQLAGRIQAALDAARAGDGPGADARLAEADAHAAGLEADVRGARGSKISAADADKLLQRLARLREHVASARAQPLR